MLLSGAKIETHFYDQKFHSDSRVCYKGSVEIKTASERVSIQNGILIDSNTDKPHFNCEFDKGPDFELQVKQKCEAMIKESFLNKILNMLDKETIWLNRSAFGDAGHVFKTTNWDLEKHMVGIEINGGNIVKGFNHIRINFNKTEAIPKTMKPSTLEKVEAFLMKNINIYIDKFIETLNKEPDLPYFRKL